MNREKMIKTAKICYTIVNVFQKILIVCLILAAFGFVMLFVNRNIVGMVSETSVSFGDVTIELNEGVIPLESIQVSRLLIIMAAAIMMMGVIYYGMQVVKNILDPMREGRPFDSDVAGNIRKLGFVTLFGGLILNGVQFLTSHLMASNTDMLLSLFKEGVVNNVTVHSEISLDFIFVSLILFLLSYVFRYGEQLQAESDETL